MSKEADELLAAEEAVQELLSELEKLKHQIGGYGAAKDSLNHVSLKLGELVQQTQKLSEATLIAITVLTKIGTPEILNSIKNINNDVINLSNRIDQLIKNQGANADKRANLLNSKVTISILISGLGLIGVIAILIFRI